MFSAFLNMSNGKLQKCAYQLSVICPSNDLRTIRQIRHEICLLENLIKFDNTFRSEAENTQITWRVCVSGNLEHNSQIFNICLNKKCFEQEF